MTTGLSELIRNVSSSTYSATGGYSCAYLNGSKNPFNINPKYIGTFLEGYCDLIKDDIDAEDQEKEGLILNLGEFINNKETIPIRASFNLRFDRHESDAIPELFTEEFLIHVAYCYQSTIAKLLKISPKYSELYCFVQESKPVVKNDNIICQLIFHFPFCQTSVSWQQRVFRPEVEQLLRRENLMSKLTYQPIGDWKEIIEPIGNVIPLYRSVDDNSKKHPSLTHIYPYISPDAVLDGKVEEVKLENVFTPTNHSFVYKEIIQTDFLDNNQDPYHWLPLLFSIFFYQGVTLPKDVDIPRSMSARPDSGYGSYNDIELADPKTLEGQKIITMHLLPLLSVDRVNNRNYWLDIGRVLYNVFSGSEEGLSEFIKFSSKATKNRDSRDENDCTDMYWNFGGNYLSAKTIAFYARMDSPEAYNVWHKMWCEASLNEALGGVTLKIANAVYRCFWLEHYHISGNKWFYFNNHRLILTNDAINLRTDITRKFIPIYEQKLAEITQKVYAEYQGDESKKREAMTVVNLITMLIKKLGGAQLNSVVNMCKDLFNPSQDPIRIDDIMAVVDSSPGKMGLKNGLIECDDEDAYVRPGKPEDFVTKTTGKPYRYDYTMEHKDVKEMKKWLRQLFPDDELFHYFMKDASSALYGSNAEKLLRIWYGDTDAGKSALEKAFEQALGQYCVSLPVEKLTGKSSGYGGGGPNPEIAQLKGAHWVFASEAESGQEGNASIIKRLTGNDRMFARMCNENGGAFEAMYKIVMTTNVIPEIKNADSATKGRFNNLLFLTRFVNPEEAPVTEREQFERRLFPKDKFFDQKIPRLSQALLWLMKEYYPIYKKEGLPVPQFIKNNITRYWEEHDLYLNFISENLTQAWIEVPFSSSAATTASATVTILPTVTSTTANETKNKPLIPANRATSASTSSVEVKQSPSISSTTETKTSTTAGVVSGASGTMVRIINAKAIITARQMYPVFRQFCINSGIQSHEIPTMAFMVSQFSDRTRLGRPYLPGKWQGVALKEQVTTI